MNFTMEGSVDVDSFDKSLFYLDKFHDGRLTLQ